MQVRHSLDTVTWPSCFSALRLAHRERALVATRELERMNSCVCRVAVAVGVAVAAPVAVAVAAAAVAAVLAAGAVYTFRLERVARVLKLCL